MEMALANEFISSVNEMKQARTMDTHTHIYAHHFNADDDDYDYFHYIFFYFYRICKLFAKFETANSGITR